MKTKLKKKKNLYRRTTKSAAPAPAPAAEVEQEVAPQPGPASQYLDVNRVLGAKAIPYVVWREWGRALDRGDYYFMWDLTAEDSAARELFGPREAFPEVCRKKSRPIPGIRGGTLQKMRINGPNEVHVVQVVGYDDRAKRLYKAERWFLLRHAHGWRIHQVDVIEVPRSDRPNTIQISDFPDVTVPEDYTAPVDEPKVVEAVSPAIETPTLEAPETVETPESPTAEPSEAAAAEPEATEE